MDREKQKYSKQILREYSGKVKAYGDFVQSMAKLCELFLSAKNIEFQVVNYRAKDIYSLKQKIKKKILANKSYENLRDIPDLAGVRIILFYKSDVEQVLKIIEEEFKIFNEENVDKKFFDPERLGNGYSSVHRIVALDGKRLSLKEYMQFENMKCEIQIRSVLQHAWAEIEHNIGYKPEFNLKGKKAKKIGRLFRSVAKKLNTVDEDFVKIRDEYERQVNDYTKKLKSKKLEIEISSESLSAYLYNREENKDNSEAKMDMFILKYEQLAKEKNWKTIKDLDDYLNAEG